MGVFLGGRQRVQDDRRAAPGALERLTRQEERLAFLEQRVGERDLLHGGSGSAAAHPEQHDRVAVVEDQEDRVAERRREEARPIEMPRFRFETELAGNVDQLPERHPVAIDQVAAPHRADFGIDAALDAHPEQAGETGLRGNRRNRRSIGAVTNNDFGWARLAGLGARPVRYSRFGLHVLLQPSGERDGPARCSLLT